MLKFKSDIFKSSKKCVFYNFYIKISKDLSAKHYQENKERLQKKARERYQNYSKEKNKKATIWS